MIRDIIEEVAALGALALFVFMIATLAYHFTGGI